MTKSIFYMAMMALSLTFFSCSKDDDDPTPTPTPTPTAGALSAKINGSAWSPGSDSTSAVLANGAINITGVAADGRTITITLNDTVTGTYDLSGAAQHAAVYQTSPSASSSYNSNMGPWTVVQNYIIISSIDKTNKKMSGIFQFKAYNFVTNDSVSVTEGSFTNLPYVTSVVSTGNNSFSVDINGVAFQPTLIAGIVASGNINITASANNGTQSVGLYVPTNITNGTYSLQPFGTYNAQYNANSSTFLLVSTGSITISEHNTVLEKIVGTFNFSAEQFGGGSQTATLTNGSFTIYY